MERVRTVVKDVCRFLDDAGIDYVLIGGLAVMVHGRPRATMDIDFIMQLSGEDLEAFVRYADEQGFDARLSDIRQAFAKQSHASIFVEGALRLDVKGVYNALDKRTMADREYLEIDGTEVAVAPAEHTIIAKLAFGSERDVEDAESIYLRQSDIDGGLLEELAQTADVSAELEAFLGRVR